MLFSIVIPIIPQDLTSNVKLKNKTIWHDFKNKTVK